MEARIINNEVFALRNNETFMIDEEIPPEGIRFFAVMARSASFPAGNHLERCSDGMPVEMVAIIACELVNDKWQWMRLGYPTKETIGSVMFERKLDKDRWYYVWIENVI